MIEGSKPADIIMQDMGNALNSRRLTRQHQGIKQGEHKKKATRLSTMGGLLLRFELSGERPTTSR
jgi:hypothetical protein